MSNLKRIQEIREGKGKSPKKYDPDEAPNGYRPMTWRLMRRFQARAAADGIDLEPQRFIIYSRLDYCLDQAHMVHDNETEYLVSEMIGEFWYTWDGKFDPIDVMFSPLTWEKTRRIVLEQLESRRLSAELDAQAEARGPVEYQAVDRESNPARPSRHKLGGHTPVGSVDGFGPEVRDFIARHEREQEETE